MSDITPSATVGPYFLFGLVPSSFGRKDLCTNQLVTDADAGERIRIEGRVYDGDGAPVPDALLEVWQADAKGQYASEDPSRRSNASFTGFGRAPTNEAGQYFIDTIKPGSVPGPNGTHQAPHIAVNVFARGVLMQMVTRIYFSDEDANRSDAVLAQVPEERRKTLIAHRQNGGDAVYRFDVHLQGENETVFFDV